MLCYWNYFDLPNHLIVPAYAFYPKLFLLPYLPPSKRIKNPYFGCMDHIANLLPTPQKTSQQYRFAIGLIFCRVKQWDIGELLKVTRNYFLIILTSMIDEDKPHIFTSFEFLLLKVCQGNIFTRSFREIHIRYKTYKSN